MSESPILLDIADHVAVLTLNRPDKLNAFAGDMREVMVARLDELAAHEEVRVLVVTGAGRGFCAGGDVQFMLDLHAKQSAFSGLRPLLEAGEAIVTRLAALPYPVIAAVNGVAAGGGASLALACDVRLASSEARFAESFVRIGLHVDWGGSYTLTRAAGLANALDLCWSGDVIPAADMLRLGLVQRVWPAAEFEREWRAYAARLAAAPSTSVRLAKQNLRAAFRRTLEECLAAEMTAQAACWDSGDCAEGVRAFADKRPAVFTAPAPASAQAPSAAARRFE